jgi:hypothetical protein
LADSGADDGSSTIDITGGPGPELNATPASLRISRFIVPDAAHGQLLSVLADDGAPLLWFHGFASVAGIVTWFALLSVVLASLAALIFLLSDGRFLSALLALALGAGFVAVLGRLLPRLEVPLFEEAELSRRLLTIVQTSRLTFPAGSFVVRGHSGSEIGAIALRGWSRLGSHRWSVLDPAGRELATATEESPIGALIAKFLGKFDSRFETNLCVRIGDREVGRVIRRPEGGMSRGTVDLPGDRALVIDRRLAVALAVLVMGLEP